jgi:oligosaccharide repeat unit polymerase
MYATNLVRGVGVLDPNSASTICRAAPPEELVTVDPTVIADPLQETGITSIDNRFFEQAFIYLGAPAIRNFSATIDGTLPSEAPSYGRISIRTLLWPFVDRETLNPTRHLGGINNGTSLIFYWYDFGPLGIAVLSALAGLLAMIAFRLAQHRSLFGLLAGAIAFNACVMSVFTDMFFEPLTAIQLALAALLHCGSYVQCRWLARSAPAT